jgi:predicted RNase H-like HicB family nuclease
MKFRAVIKKRSHDWWIGWLVDLPGVNAQEKSREELIQSLKMGAAWLLTTPHLIQLPGQSLNGQGYLCLS